MENLNKLILDCIERNNDASFTARNMFQTGTRLDEKLADIKKMSEKKLTYNEQVSIKRYLIDVQNELHTIAEQAFAIILFVSAARESIATRRFNDEEVESEK